MKEWKHDRLCLRQVSEARDYKSSLKKYCTYKMRFSKLQFFELMVPKQFFITVMLVAMDKNLPMSERKESLFEVGVISPGTCFLVDILKGPVVMKYYSAFILLLELF